MSIFPTQTQTKHGSGIAENAQSLSADKYHPLHVLNSLATKSPLVKRLVKITDGYVPYHTRGQPDLSNNL